jgi:hypothetical protein
MNYTADANDAEHLAGPSPWGSSSPKADRTSFPTSSNDVPHSPVQAPRQSLYPGEQDSPNASRYQDASDRAYQQAATAVPAGEDAGLLNSSQQPQSMSEGSTEDSEQPQYGTQQQRQGAARYQTARQQRTVPQYKLQAKITALERSGRKDPVLRFDVYVRLLYCWWKDTLLSMLNRPIYQSSGPHSSAMSAALIPNSPSLQTT